MAKSVEERIEGWLKKGFTAKTESLPTHFDELIVYVDLEMSPKQKLDLVRLLGKDFTYNGSNFDDLLRYHLSNLEDPNAIKIEFDVTEDYPRFSEAYGAFLRNPLVLGVVSNVAGKATILHQKPGFECPEVKRSREKTPTHFGRTKVKAPFVMKGVN